MTDEGFADAMRRCGWRYEHASNGYVKGHHWVSLAQAEAAFAAAERGEPQVIEPMSRTVAEVVGAAVINDGANNGEEAASGV